jgi:hypothetical protein
LSLRCGLGYHAANGVPRWNDGHYFARCARCGVDLVRTPFSRWHVPNGYRVVWQAQPPASRPDVTLEPELQLEQTEPQVAPVAKVPAPMEVPAAEEVVHMLAVAAPAQKPARADDKRRRLPVEALLERLRGTPGPSAAPPEPSVPAALPRRPAWDFMMEPEERARSAEHQAATSNKAVAKKTEDRATPIAAETSQPHIGPSIATRAFIRLRRHAASTYRRARHNKQLVQVAFATLIAAPIVAAGVLWLPEPPISENQVSYPKQVIPVDTTYEPETIPAATAASFVAARALSCRDAPALQARRVRVLARGASVQVLARDGEWVSLATSAGQCWAIGKYVSEPRPL